MDDVLLVTEISRHLRQLALTLYPATDVASLTGSNWLQFLDSHSRQTGFLQVPGCYLAELPYRKNNDSLSHDQKIQLMALARQWAIDNLRGNS